LGHATRCVPLIKQLAANNTVIIGTTPLTRLVLNQEFPDLQNIDIEPYDIRYSKHIPLLIKLMSDAPRILRVIKKEREQLKRIVEDHGVNLVISDNRFGLSHPSVESIYITHQLNIRASVFSALANRVHHQYIRKFSKVWVPDFEDRQKSLAGELTLNPGIANLTYLGPLSRLTIPTGLYEPFDYLIVLSGAEPQRSILEEKLCRIFRNTEKKVVLVRGSLHPIKTLSGNIQVIDLPDTLLLAKLIKAAETVICRSGYSSLMDMHSLQKKNLILIPTPGQSEQIYLADYWQERFGANVIRQENISLWKP